MSPQNTANAYMANNTVQSFNSIEPFKQPRSYPAISSFKMSPFTQVVSATSLVPSLFFVSCVVLFGFFFF